MRDNFPRMIVVTFQHPNPYYDDSYAVNSANVGPYGDALLEEPPRPAERAGQGHVPHGAVHVVQPDAVGAAAPDRRQEGHAVPDLHEGVAVAVATGHLGHDRTGEHHVAPGLADDGVPAAPHVLGVAGRVRRAVHHLDAGLGPE